MKSTAILAVLLAAASAGAVNLPESPVHRAMRAALYADKWNEGRDEQFGSDRAGIDEQTGQKSVFKAAALSILIPGGGQYYVGNKRTARYFFTAEVLTWCGFAAFRTYGNWRREDYINYAADHAHAILKDKSDDFIDLVGFYSNIRDYNAFGRVYDPERPYLADTPENHWEWQTREEQRNFRDLKNRSRDAYRKADFMIGVAVVNRVLSAIEASREASRAKRRISTGLSESRNKPALRFAVDPMSDNRQVSLTLFPGF